MLFYILIFFGLYGWIEFEALIYIGSEIGGLATFLGIFVTAFIGMWLLRSQGRAVLVNWQNNLSKGELEAQSLASGISLVLGGLLMLLPGYVTDAIGILCFVPGLRTVIGGVILSRFQIAKMSSRFSRGFSGGFAGGSGTDSARRETYDTGHTFDTDPSSPRQNPRTRRQNRLDGDIIEGDFEQKD